MSLPVCVPAPGVIYTREYPILEAKGISKSFGSKPVLGDITFTIRDLRGPRCLGQVTAVIGPSGVGKSVLLQILSGLDQPTSGEVVIDEKFPARKGHIGVVFQKYPLFCHRTVIGNIVLAGKLSGLSDAEARCRGLEYLGVFGLVEDADKYPIQLSGGMQQRVAIIRQLINMEEHGGSRIILMDEPFSALDSENTWSTCLAIRRSADLSERNTILVVTHDLRAALSVADQVIVLKRTPKGAEVHSVMELSNEGFAWSRESHDTSEFREKEQGLRELFRAL